MQKWWVNLKKRVHALFLSHSRCARLANINSFNQAHFSTCLKRPDSILPSILCMWGYFVELKIAINFRSIKINLHHFFSVFRFSSVRHYTYVVHLHDVCASWFIEAFLHLHYTNPFSRGWKHRFVVVFAVIKWFKVDKDDFARIVNFGDLSPLIFDRSGTQIQG